MVYLIPTFLIISLLINVSECGSTVCPSRHYLSDDKKCVKCLPNCLECFSSSFCKKCKENFCGSNCLLCSSLTTTTTTTEIYKSIDLIVKSKTLPAKIQFLEKTDPLEEEKINNSSEKGNHSFLIVLLLAILISLMTIFLLAKIWKCFHKSRKKAYTFQSHFDENVESQSQTSSCLTKKKRRNVPSPLTTKKEERIVSNTFPNSSLNEGSLLLDEKEPLGRGQFGTVYKCQYVENCEYIWVAIKIANFTSKEASKESSVLSKLSHLNIIKLKTVNMKNSLILVMPFRQCDLKHFLKEEKDRITDCHQIRYCMQIADACRYMISQEIIHCDLKASNILVVNINHIEISDFGKSEVLGKGKHTLGTATHVALELLKEKKAFACEATDVWSFGVTAWEIFTFGSKIPYTDELNCIKVDETALTSFLANGKRLNIPEKLHLNVQRAIRACWLESSHERPTFNQLFLAFSNSLPEGTSYAVHNVLEV